MAQFLSDRIKHSWTHFTSSWVYPAVLIAFLILLILPGFGIGGFAYEIAFRLFLLAVALLSVYDQRFRLPRMKRQRELEAKAKH